MTLDHGVPATSGGDASGSHPFPDCDGPTLRLLLQFAERRERPGPESPMAAGAALARSCRDYLTGRVLPPRGHLDGLLDSLDEALECRAIGWRDLEEILATAEGHHH